MLSDFDGEVGSSMMVDEEEKEEEEEVVVVVVGKCENAGGRDPMGVIGGGVRVGVVGGGKETAGGREMTEEVDA